MQAMGKNWYADWKKTLLAVSAYATLLNANHAGGKINYWYLKKLESVYDITCIAGVSRKECISKLNLSLPNYSTH